MERQTLTVSELGRILGIGRNSAYLAVERGEIRSIRLGKRIVIPRAELERLLAGEQGVGQSKRLVVNTQADVQ